MDIEHRHFTYLARYNKAANVQLVQLLSTLPAAELARPRGSYFGSLQGILDHVIMCDINWLRRIRILYPNDEPLNRPRLAPPGHAWTDFSFPDFGEYRRERGTVDSIFEDWIAQADTSRFGEVLAYSDSHGKPMRFYLREAVDHVFNHQTHHRGQGSQILDELKVEHDFSNLIGVAEIPPAE
jgi:uncharacterized damage-inducible protein DinB